MINGALAAQSDQARASLERHKQAQADQRQRELRKLRASDQYRALGPDDFQRVRDWIAAHLPSGRRLTCFCGKADWTISERLVGNHQVAFRDGEFVLASAEAPSVLLTATCCGEQRRLCAATVGVCVDPRCLAEDVEMPIRKRVPIRVGQKTGAA